MCMEHCEDHKEILFITTTLTMGGVQKYLQSYIPFLIDSGLKISIAIQTKEKHELYEQFVKMGCKIYSITPIMSSWSSYMRDIRRIIKENSKICAVYDNQNYLNIFSLFAAKQCGIKVRISHSHSCYETKGIKRKIQRMLFRLLLPVFATSYFACSKLSAKWLYGKHSQSKRCVIINNAVDDKKFKYNEELRTKTRRELGVEDKFVFIHVGMFTEAKNHKFLIRVFLEYHKENPDSVLLLCGDGILKKDILDEIKQSHIENSVRFLGIVQDVEKYFFASDMLLFPSKYEGFSISVAEAQASGIDCVVSGAVPNDVLLNDNVKKCSSFSIEEWIANIKVLQQTTNRVNYSKAFSGTKYTLTKNGEIFVETIKELIK